MTDTDPVAERFFYHNFPRRADGSQSDKGLKILRSMCQNGLLLVPEIVEWTDPSGSLAGDTTVSRQRRCCFTELAPVELAGHANEFGPFAWEFPIEVLRQLGALPVFYVPNVTGQVPSLAQTGVSILSRLADATQILGALESTQKVTGPTFHVWVKDRHGKMVGTRDFNAQESAAIREYIAALQAGPGQSFSEILGALSSAASIFYPTDNLKYTGPLDYYRQREWRLISGMHANGVSVTSFTTEAQQKELLEIDEGFFSKTLDYPDGKYSKAAKSHYMAKVDGRHILSFASRLIVPEDAEDVARQILKEQSLNIPVVLLGALRGEVTGTS